MKKYDLASRITPAYAGKSILRSSFGRSSWDHPRLCGEKPKDGTAKTAETGSPPPMRGKAQPAQRRRFAVGITPAYAGKRPDQGLSGVCRTGSPPPMRGKVWRQCYRDSSIGITPAYAGKRNNPIQKWKWNRDHPRLCGEKSLGRCIRRRCEGSPPPMRGKGKQRGVRLGHGRITPAYAGKR